MLQQLVKTLTVFLTQLIKILPLFSYLGCTMQSKLEPAGTIKEVTIIYYGELSLELQHSVEHFLQLENGRVIIPDSYKQDKSIIAVCDGAVNILNKFGERIEFTPYHSNTV